MEDCAIPDGLGCVMFSPRSQVQLGTRKKRGRVFKPLAVSPHSVYLPAKTIERFRKTIDGFRRTIGPFAKTIERFDDSIDPFRKTIDGFPKTIDPFPETIDSFAKTIDGFAKTIDPFDQQIDGFAVSIDPLPPPASREPRKSYGLSDRTNSSYVSTPRRLTASPMIRRTCRHKFACL